MARRVSVIVPIYNVEKYLRRCIDSILAQTYENFELILIDDGSPDRCGEIIDEYAKKDARIVPIHQKNKGVSAARNAGIDIAKGEYLSFINPDDWVSESFLQLLIDGIEKENADISCCNFDSFSDTETFKSEVDLPTGAMDRNEWISHMFDRPRTTGGSNCNKLFRRSAIQYGYDESLRISEDNLFLLQNSINIRKAFYLNQPLYHVFLRPDSATRTDDAKLIESLAVEKRISEILKNNDRHLFRLAETEYLDRSLLLYNQFRSKSPLTAKIAQDAIREYVRKNLKSILTNKEIGIKQKVLYFKV